jgi:hypothetical protein
MSSDEESELPPFLPSIQRTTASSRATSLKGIQENIFEAEYQSSVENNSYL